MLEDVESPPYPSEGSTANSLLGHLKQLRKWIHAVKADMVEQLGQDFVPEVIEVPDAKLFLALPVMTHYQQLVFMRKLREEWDHIIRIYEDDWECKSCMKHRAILIQTAALFFNSAFTPFEVREARAQQSAQNVMKGFSNLTEHFKKIMDPERYGTGGEAAEREDEE